LTDELNDGALTRTAAKRYMPITGSGRARDLAWA